MLSKKVIYQLLEEKMLGYDEIAAKPFVTNDELLVPIQKTNHLGVNPIEPKMLAITGKEIYVRQRISDMLTEASRAFALIDTTLQLEVVYGYRHPSIQHANFEAMKQKIARENPKLSDVELLEAANRCIAAPENAGHTAGAAVDVRLLSHSSPLDMGTESRAFVRDTYVFSPFISKTAWGNRQVLRNVMVSVGFAPFDGEWWHFCYGDKEWAAYYDKPSALYGPVEFSVEPRGCIRSSKE